MSQFIWGCNFKVHGNIWECFKITIPQTHNALSIYMTNVRFTSAKIICFSLAFFKVFLLTILKSPTSGYWIFVYKNLSSFILLMYSVARKNSIDFEGQLDYRKHQLWRKSSYRLLLLFFQR